MRVALTCAGVTTYKAVKVSGASPAGLVEHVVHAGEQDPVAAIQARWIQA